MSILDKSSSKMQDFLGFIWSFVIMSKSRKTGVISKIEAIISKLLAELIMYKWYNFTLSTLLAEAQLAENPLVSSVSNQFDNPLTQAISFA